MNTVVSTRYSLIQEVIERVRDAHTRWESDCLALDLRLSDRGLPFGARGYACAVERGVARLVEGVSLALDYVRQNVSPRSPAWPLAHRAIVDALEQEFLATSRLIPAPAADPVLEGAYKRARQRVMRHCRNPQPPWRLAVRAMRHALVRLPGRWRR